MRHSRVFVGLLTAMGILISPVSPVYAEDAGESESVLEWFPESKDENVAEMTKKFTSKTIEATQIEGAELEKKNETESVEVESTNSNENEVILETDFAEESTEEMADDASLKHCIVISSDENIGTNAYFPEVPLIAGYTTDDRPVDENENVIYGWGQDELGYSFKFFDENGKILYQSNQNEVALARTKGTSHISLYLNYPDAGNRTGTFKGASLYFHFVSKETHLEYAFEVPYLSRNANIRIPVGIYEKCYVTASEGITLPDDYFFPSTCFVQALKNSHMDFFASTIQLSADMEFLVNGIDPYDETLELGAADPMLPTAPPVETTSTIEIQPTAEGLLERLQARSDDSQAVNLVVVLAIIFAVFIVVLLAMSCIYGMYMYRGRRKEIKNEKKKSNTIVRDDGDCGSDNGDSSTSGRC